MNEIDEMNSNLETLNEKITENTSKTDALRKEFQDLPEILANLAQRRIDLRRTTEDIEKLREELAKLEDLGEEIAESDEQLEELKNNYGERVIKLEQMNKEKEENKEKLKQAVKAFRIQQDKKNTEVGKAMADKGHYEKQLEKREKLVRTLSRRHNIRGYDDDLDDDMVTEFRDKLAEKYRDQTDRLSKIKVRIHWFWSV